MGIVNYELVQRRLDAKIKTLEETSARIETKMARALVKGLIAKVEVLEARRAKLAAKIREAQQDKERLLVAAEVQKEQA